MTDRSAISKDGANGGRRQLDLGIDARPRSVDRKYGRYVRGLKLVLPATAAIIVITVFAWPQIQLHEKMPDPDTLKIRPQDTADLTVLGVRYVGTDARDRQYTVTAASTRQADPDAKEVVLENPEADMDLRDGRKVELRAESGVFDRQRSALELKGAVRFSQDGELEISTPQASIDFREGRAEGDAPVSMQASDGVGQGQGFRVTDDGRRVFLTGKSSLKFDRAPGGGS